MNANRNMCISTAVVDLGYCTELLCCAQQFWSCSICTNCTSSYPPFLAITAKGTNIRTADSRDALMLMGSTPYLALSSWTRLSRSSFSRSIAWWNLSSSSSCRNLAISCRRFRADSGAMHFGIFFTNETISPRLWSGV